jgi:hypothetical protein
MMVTIMASTPSEKAFSRSLVTLILRPVSATG